MHKSSTMASDMPLVEASLSRSSLEAKAEGTHMAGAPEFHIKVGGVDLFVILCSFTQNTAA